MNSLNQLACASWKRPAKRLRANAVRMISFWAFGELGILECGYLGSFKALVLVKGVLNDGKNSIGFYVVMNKSPNIRVADGAPWPFIPIQFPSKAEEPIFCFSPHSKYCQTLSSGQQVAFSTTTFVEGHDAWGLWGQANPGSLCRPLTLWRDPSHVRESVSEMSN